MEPETLDKGHTVTVPGWLDLRISLGHIIIAISACGSVLIAYTKLDGRVTFNEQKQAVIESTYVRREMVDQQSRFLESQLADVKAALSRVERKLDEIK